MDSAFIICFLLLGIRLTQALTPDEYINLRRRNHTSRSDVMRPSPVQIFMHPPKNQKAKVSGQPDVIHRRSEKFEAPSPSEYYTFYDDIPEIPKKHQATTKPAFAVAKYDDYYPVRKPSSKAKSHHASPGVKKPKRPVQVFSENTDRAPSQQGRNSNAEGPYPKKHMHNTLGANKLVNGNEPAAHRHAHGDTRPDHREYETPSGKKQEYREYKTPNDKRQDHREHQILNDKRQEDHREETKSMSATEQVQKLMSQSEDDKLLVAATGYGGKTREQFHEQGMEGPHSYKFGYNTGDSYNPMARYEERDADGVVRGSYSYIDARGKLQVVHYESHPKLGFRTKSGHGSYPY